MCVFSHFSPGLRAKERTCAHASALSPSVRATALLWKNRMRAPFPKVSDSWSLVSLSRLESHGPLQTAVQVGFALPAMSLGSILDLKTYCVTHSRCKP